jgi:hypothetical protein
VVREFLELNAGFCVEEKAQPEKTIGLKYFSQSGAVPVSNSDSGF